MSLSEFFCILSKYFIRFREQSAEEARDFQPVGFIGGGGGVMSPANMSASRYKMPIPRIECIRVYFLCVFNTDV